MPPTAITYTLTLPDWTPPVLNAVRGRHWSVEHKTKKQLAELLAAYALAQGVPHATGPRRVGLTVILGPGSPSVALGGDGPEDEQDVGSGPP